MTSISQFDRHNFINLETFRKNGQGVCTPVWFDQQGNVIFVWTQASSGKVKRIRRNPSVRIAPCTANGSLLGDWVAGQASIQPDAEIPLVNRRFRRKYGLQKLFFDLLGGFSKSKIAILKIQLSE
jgi:hypothetical protein